MYTEVFIGKGISCVQLSLKWLREKGHIKTEERINGVLTFRVFRWMEFFLFLFFFTILATFL